MTKTFGLHLSRKARETIIGCAFIVALLIWPQGYRPLLFVCIVWAILKPKPNDEGTIGTPIYR